MLRPGSPARRADEGPGVLEAAWRSRLDSQSCAPSPAKVTGQGGDGGTDREPGCKLALGRYLVAGWMRKGVNEGGDGEGKCDTRCQLTPSSSLSHNPK